MVKRIAQTRDAGVVLSSHLLSEIEGVCDDVVIMNAGQVVAKGTVAEVIAQAVSQGRGDAIRVRVARAMVEPAQRALEAAPGVRQATLADEVAGWFVVELAQNGGQATPGVGLARNRVLDALIRAEIPVLGFEAAGGRLQDVFLQLTAESIE
jgi:ABC-2 type transport system ATP-binding protein